MNSPTGVFYYQLTTLVVIFGALIVAIGRHDAGTNFPVRRMIWGFVFLLLVRLGLAVTALGAVAANLAPDTLVLLEKGVTTISWVLIVWLWCFPEKARAADGATVLLALLIAAVTLLGIALLANPPAPTWPSQSLSVISMLVLAAGILLLLRNRPDAWGYGLAMLFVLWMAEAVNAFFPAADGSFPIAIRLAQITALPILLTLPTRVVLEPIVEMVQQPIMRSAPERKRVNMPPGVLGRFLTLATEKDMLALCRGLSEAVSYALVADICLVLSRPTSSEEVIVYCGYDQVLEQEIAGTQIEARQLPMIASAIQKQTPLRLPASSASSDLKALSATLRLPKSGHLLVAPIPGAAEIGALVLLTPYSSRTWSQDDQAYLAQAADQIGSLLDKAARPDRRLEPDELREQLEASQAREAELKLEVQRLADIAADIVSGEQVTDLETLLASLSEAKQASSSLEAQLEILQERNEELESSLGNNNWDQTIQHLQAENIQLQLSVGELEKEKEDLQARASGFELAQKEARNLIEHLHSENDRLRAEIDGRETDAETLAAGGPNGSNGRPDKSLVESELKEALREIAHLRTQVGEAEIKILELENLASASTNVTRQWETIIALAEEMRQPMSSILGYSDFLLTESVGLLGAMQRKFLERVKSSTNRMSAMIEDLINVAAVESGKMKLSLGTVDLTSVIDSAIAATSVQMREKSIILRVNLPENLPTIEGDREAIRLTLIHLLHNAAAVTPKHGEIKMEITLDTNAEGVQFVQLSVTDSGDGIAPDDLSKIFERRLKSRDQLIPGLGVSNSGLSISKTLVEAHGGRIWVENRDDRKGAIFSILLPLRQDESSMIFGKKEI